MGLRFSVTSSKHITDAKLLQRERILDHWWQILLLYLNRVLSLVVIIQRIVKRASLASIMVTIIEN